MRLRDERIQQAEQEMRESKADRCALYDFVLHTKDPDSERRCYLCEYGTKVLKRAKCAECLDTIHLDGFTLDHNLQPDPRWDFIRDKI